MNGLTSKRQLGSYYTPLQISQILCNWAVRSAHDQILEPGFGGCGFLEASKQSLQSLGCKQTNRHIYGCDRDTSAFDHLAEKIGPTKLDRRFILADFLDLKPRDFSAHEFDAVIGNPPYVSLHNMSQEQLEKAKSLNFADINIEKRASLWAYFIVHALGFLRKGGRCAWVLPSSFIHAAYSTQIKKLFQKKFDRILVIPVKERFFIEEGAKESTVILLADGWNNSSQDGSSQICFADSSQQVKKIIQDWDEGRMHVKNSPAPESFENSWLSDNAKLLLDNLTENNSTHLLGSFATIRIGIVTGANKFFIINQELADKNNLPKSALKPILAKMSQTNSISLSSAKLEKNRLNNLKNLLLDTSGRKSKPVTLYLLGFPRDKLESIATFKKRAIWHQPDDNQYPDAFLSYMSNSAPRMILNRANTTSTNTIHRIYFDPCINESRQMLIAISLLSSYSQLSAEIVGRSYGSGVLKLEPGEAKRLSLVLPDTLSTSDIQKAFNEVNLLLETEEYDKAYKRVDSLILKPVFGSEFEHSMSIIYSSLERIRAIRKGM